MKKKTRTTLAAFNQARSLRTVYEAVWNPDAAIFVAFVLSLGIAEANIGVIKSALGFAGLLQVAALPIICHVVDRKRLIILVGVAEPIIIGLTVALSLLLPQGARLVVLAAAVFLAAALVSLASPVVDEWIASAIPPSLRGRFLARRFLIVGIISLVSAPIIGRVADWIGKGNAAGLAGFVGVACLFGVASASSMGRAEMPQQSLEAKVRWADYLAVLRRAEFRRYLLALIALEVPMAMATTYTQVFNLNTLGLRLSTIGWMMAGYQAVRILTMPLWGRLVSRWGAGRVTATIFPLYAAYLLFMAFSTREHAWIVFVAVAFFALGDSAFPIAATSVLYESLPDKGPRPAYFAVLNVVNAAIGAVTPLLALGLVLLINRLFTFPIRIGWLELGPYQVLFACAAGMILPALYLARALIRKAKSSQPDGPSPTTA